MNNTNTVTMDVFSTTTLQGSPQSITFVPSKSLIPNLPTCIMQPGVDYTVAYFDSCSNKVDAVWRNHHNIIQFCGSAAFGISYYLLHTYELPYLTIQSNNLTLHAEYDSEVSLYIPAIQISLVSTQFFDYGRLHHEQDNGIYFLEVEDKDTLQNISWEEEDLYALPLEDPHGLCLFCWHTSTHTGYVRYFNPWYGREEDTVTGSIQSYLVPYVAHMYGMHSQSWVQLSQRGGYIRSLFINDKVCLRGICAYTSNLP